MNTQDKIRLEEIMKQFPNEKVTYCPNFQDGNGPGTFMIGTPLDCREPMNEKTKKLFENEK